MSKTKVQAHRGFSAIAPENTLPAFKKAVEIGADAARVKAWEAARQETLAWFEDNFYGRPPLGRPDDMAFGEREISFAGGRIAMHLQVKLPADASCPNCLRCSTLPMDSSSNRRRKGMSYR